MKKSKFRVCKMCGKNFLKGNGFGKNKRFCSILCSNNSPSQILCNPICLESNMIILDVEFKNKTFHTKRICKICRKGNFVKRSKNAIELNKKQRALEITNPNEKIELKQIQQTLVNKYGDSFYTSINWLKLRYLTLLKYGATCSLCGSIEKPMHVDHIKPRSKFKHLELDPDNLQVLCKNCNIGKSDSF